jgi:hypothetical protein
MIESGMSACLMLGNVISYGNPVIVILVIHERRERLSDRICCLSRNFQIESGLK